MSSQSHSIRRSTYCPSRRILVPARYERIHLMSGTQHSTGEVIGFARRQERNPPCGQPRRDKTTTIQKRLKFRDPSLACRRSRCFFNQGRSHEPWSESKDADTVCLCHGGETVGQHHHSRFAAAISGSVRSRRALRPHGYPERAHDVDDSAAMASDHSCQDRSTAEKRPQEVRRNIVPPRLGRHFPDGPDRAAAPGVVDQDVDWAQPLYHFVDDVIHSSLFCDVCWKGKCPPAGHLNGLSGRTDSRLGAGTSATATPAAARVWAIASPIPRLPPVMIATWPCNDSFVTASLPRE